MLKVFEVPLKGQTYSLTRVEIDGFESEIFKLSQIGHFFFSSKSMALQRVIHLVLIFNNHYVLT